MKKVLFSLAAVALLLSSCGSDENIDNTAPETGTLITKVTFDGITTKAASSTAIPSTSWDNIKQVQMFLYKADGTVAYSDIIDPATDADKKFTWTNIPEGTYSLALVANIDSNTGKDNIATSLDHGTTWVPFDAYNVRDRKINTDVFIDLKKSTIPPAHPSIGSPYMPYTPVSEVFTAYAATITIVKGTTVELSGASALKLKREISLMRLRVDRENKTSAPALKTVDFGHAESLITVENLPVGLGLKLDAFEGGIYSTAFDPSRIMIAAHGTGAYKTADPTTGYDPKVILGGTFTLWNDIQVLPNATRAENIAPDKDAAATKRYVITLAAWAPAGYVYDDDSVAPTGGALVYWSGTIKGVFSPNFIREVNMTIKSKGKPTKPIVVGEGELIIEVSTPEPWDSNIQSEDIDV